MKRILIISVVVLLVSAGVLCYAGVLENMQKKNTPPVILCDDEVLEISCNYTQEDLMQGITAEDAEDGDLTDSVVVGQLSMFIDEKECELTYVVFDSANKSASYVRTVRLTDYAPPSISLAEPLVYPVGTGTYEQTVSKIRITDKLEGDISNWMNILSYNTSYATPGSYHFEIEASNSAGDTVSAKLPVHVVDKSRYSHDIKLTKNLVYASVGEDINPEDYLESVITAGGGISPNMLKNVTAKGADTSVPGVTEIHYVLRKDDVVAAETWLTVIVTE